MFILQFSAKLKNSFTLRHKGSEKYIYLLSLKELDETPIKGHLLHLCFNPSRPDVCVHLPSRPEVIPTSQTH